MKFFFITLLILMTSVSHAFVICHGTSSSSCEAVIEIFGHTIELCKEEYADILQKFELKHIEIVDKVDCKQKTASNPSANDYVVASIRYLRY